MTTGVVSEVPVLETCMSSPSSSFKMCCLEQLGPRLLPTQCLDRPLVLEANLCAGPARPPPAEALLSGWGRPGATCPLSLH